MADPNPIASTDDDNELLNTSDPYELSSHTAEFEELLSTQIKEAYSRNQSLQSELLEQVHQNLNSQIQSTILRLKENNQILTEIEEFQIICEDINQNYTQLSQIVVYKALGHHIARIEPRRYVEISMVKASGS